MKLPCQWVRWGLTLRTSIEALAEAEHLAGGEVRPSDQVRVELPPEPHHALKPV